MKYWIKKKEGAHASEAETWMISMERGSDAPAYPEECWFEDESSYDAYHFDSYAEMEEYTSQDQSKGCGWREVL